MHRLLVLRQRLRSVAGQSRRTHRNLLIFFLVVIAFLTFWLRNSRELAQYYQLIPARLNGLESGVANP